MTTTNDMALTVPPVTHALTSVDSLHASVLAQPNKNTVRAYQQAMNAFAKYIGADDSLLALKVLLSVDHGFANRLVQGYVTHMETVEKLAPNSIALRISALRSVVKDGRRFGLINWSLEVKLPLVETYRDTAGPGEEAFAAMLAVVSDGSAKSVRDLAILRLLYSTALRRGEVVSLDIDSFEHKFRSDGRSVLRVIGKGRKQTSRITVPKKPTAAILNWLQIRGDEPGPLFCSIVDGKPTGRRLIGTGVWKIVNRIGKRAGVRVWPHALRHSGITKASKMTGGNYDEVKRFSRHKNIDTVERYVDNQKDIAGSIADLVDGD